MISNAIEQKESRIYEDELYRQPLNASASYQFSPYKEQASTTCGQNSGNYTERQKGRCSMCAWWLPGSPPWWEPISPQRLGLARGHACQAQTANQQSDHPVCSLANTRVAYWFPNEVRVAEET